MRTIAITLSFLVLASPALAEFQRVTERESFVSLVEDKDLTRLGIRLQVTTDGKIQGRAFGQRVSGDWDWNGGFFCRDLYVNDDMLDPDNCQLVEVKGNTLRFTSDRGRGEFADLRLK